MLRTFFIFCCLFFFFLVLETTMNAHAQGLQAFSTVAAEDFAAYKESNKVSPKWDPFVEEGFNAMDREDIQTAIEFLRKAVNEGCSSPIVLFKLALGYESQGSYYSAIQYYERAHKEFQTTNQNHGYYKEFAENYGRALYMMGQMTKALPILEEAAKVKSTPFVLKILLEHYLSQEDTEKASSTFATLLKTQEHGLTIENQINYNLQLARIYRKLNDTKLALMHYEAILVLDGENKEAKDFMKNINKQNSYERMFEMLQL